MCSISSSLTVSASLLHLVLFMTKQKLHVSSSSVTPPRSTILIWNEGDGSAPDWPLPQGVLYRDAHHFCAKTGRRESRHANAGAWCGFHHPNFGIVFDKEEVPRGFLTPRAHLFCISRCIESCPNLPLVK